MDMDVASFALAQPPRRRFAGSHSKPILREIGAPYLDPRALNATKRGFGMPISYWFRGPMAQQILELARSAHEWDHLQLLNHRYLEELAVQHTAGYANHDARLWSIWCLRIWEKSLPQ